MSKATVHTDGTATLSNGARISAAALVRFGTEREQFTDSQWRRLVRMSGLGTGNAR